MNHMSLYHVLLWLHVLCMAGAFGGLLILQAGVPRAVRSDADAIRPAIRWLNILLGLGLISGALLYGSLQGHTRGGHFNGVIGLKFVLLLAVGGLLAVSRRSPRGDTMRAASLILLALAALSGVTI